MLEVKNVLSMGHEVALNAVGQAPMSSSSPDDGYREAFTVITIKKLRDEIVKQVINVIVHIAAHRDASHWVIL